MKKTEYLTINCRKCEHEHVFQAVDGGGFFPVIHPKEANKFENFYCILCHDFCIKTTSSEIGHPCDKCKFYVMRPLGFKKEWKD